MIYLDHNATTPLDPRVLEAMMPYLERYHGNPSSLCRLGRLARAAVDLAREQLAALVSVKPRQVIFTSGATEASNMALMGLKRRLSKGKLLSGQTEHPSVRETLNALSRKTGWPLEFLPIEKDGRHRLLPETLFQGGPVLAALMSANNETGVMEETWSLAERVRAAGGFLHVDAVQTAGKAPLEFAATGAHTLSLSAHKLGGPKGIGALILEPGLQLDPLMQGGGQEFGLRPGTEPVALIVGWGVAADIAREALSSRRAELLALRERLEAGLCALDGMTIHARSAPRLPNTVQFSLEGWEGEALVMALDRAGFCVSSGSACASGGHQPSPVLTAMGVDDDLARGAVRVSLGQGNDEKAVDAFLSALSALVHTTQTSRDHGIGGTT